MGKYGVILADPPWQYDVSHRNGAAERHYDTMSLERLAALPVSTLAADDCVLLLWATWPKLDEAALPLIKAWGFKYTTGIPWIKIVGLPKIDLFGTLTIKPAFGTGFWFRGATEPILLAKRGNPKFPDNDPIGLICDRMQHSRKPDNLYHYAETLTGPYLELFARRPRSGWDIWGNQVSSTVELTAP